MTRPKVDPDKRQRTAQACDSCKRRKQKCNGLVPCNTCTKRQLDCLYTSTQSGHLSLHESVRSPTKRRHLDTSPPSVKSDPDCMVVSARRDSTLTTWHHSPSASGASSSKSAVGDAPCLKTNGTVRQLPNGSDRDFDSKSRISNVSGGLTDDDDLWLPRMLQDSTGRLLYVGDSASLSYLQLIRMIVESVSGPSEFTTDPRRHMIMENTISLGDARPTGVLPDRQTADILVESFFTNTRSFIQVFDKKSFLESLDECYSDPLNTNSTMLCLLYLVLAIGLVIARPQPGSAEEAVIHKLRLERANRAELFYRSARTLADPVSGFEDGDFWSIQALVLTSFYMLAVSKRNAAYAYHGMAVRSAYALGLHREESMTIFDETQIRVRRNLWRTLFILDRFLSACLGRPMGISDDECSENALEAPETSTRAGSGLPDQETETICAAALDATVRTCHIIGATLKKVYSRRRISTQVAQEIAEQLERWNRELHPRLHWRRMLNGAIDATHGNAVLHTNLLHFHSVILLTRPFLLCLLAKAQEYYVRKSERPYRPSQRVENFAQTCVEASQHTLVLARAALDAKYLPQCNPFVIHFVFAAALIILSNEFAALYANPDAESAVRSAISILRFCAAEDKQAERVTFIVESFHQANVNRPATARRLSIPGRDVPAINTLSQNARYDPVLHLFRHSSDVASVHSPLHREHHLPPATSSSSVSLLKDRAHAVVGPAMPPISSSMPPLMPGGMSSMLHQQPSPEGSSSHSVPLSSGGGLHASSMDTTSGGESEIDFDMLWNSWPTPNTSATSGNAGGTILPSLPPPAPASMQPADGFGSYAATTIGQSQVIPSPHAPQPPPPLGSNPNVNVSVPLYPPTSFR